MNFCEINEIFNGKLRNIPIDSTYAYMIIKYSQKNQIAKEAGKPISKEKYNTLKDMEELLLMKNGTNSLLKLSYPCEELVKEYKQKLKESIKLNTQINLTHITDVSLNNLHGGVLKKSIGQITQFGEEKVDAVFASSNDMEGNPYLIRVGNNGMIRIDNNAYLLGDNNLEIKNDTVQLTNPGYIYTLKNETFEPVVTIIRGNANIPEFRFDGEWISKSNLKENDILSVTEYKDVTKVIENYQIYTRMTKQKINTDNLKNTVGREQLVKLGVIRDINAEAHLKKDVELNKEYR